MNVAVALNILGLVLDIGGFTLVGRELLKHPGSAHGWAATTVSTGRGLWASALS
jgi:hypothetical protein